jgi:hypothetical protein
MGASTLLTLHDSCNIMICLGSHTGMDWRRITYVMCVYQGSPTRHHALVSKNAPFAARRISAGASDQGTSLSVISSGREGGTLTMETPSTRQSTGALVSSQTDRIGCFAASAFCPSEQLRVQGVLPVVLA